ncbi:conserved uncharacterized protein, DUF389 [Desulfosarcina variabilis str. Montpellier]|uniref:DUF389 domain-containing protein n=1 Tax=Desulfosarcina variabilis TaxID=2300 RepID=UPI003AFADE4F
MQDYVSSVLFVHTIETEPLVERLRDHPSQATIKPVLFDALMADSERVLAGVEHVVVSGPLETIKSIVLLAAEHGFSVGAIPTDRQRRLARFYDIHTDVDSAIDLALSADPVTMDLVLCNGHVVLFQATVGQLPLLDAPADSGKLSMLKAALPRIFKIDLIKYRLATQAGEEIITAASGCMILHHPKGSIAGRLIAGDTTIADGSIGALISAPMSVIKYLKFLFQLMSHSAGSGKLLSSIGYLKSPVIEIEPETELDIWIDGEKQARTPLRCEVKASAIRINAGPAIRSEAPTGQIGAQRVDTDHLPRGKELKKAWKRERIPFFSYASEERFYDLFTALRDDSKINGLYLVLMVLSTMLAAAGLYLDSASVIIGAMLLAPLMAPIVSLAMGLLRGEETMIRNSLVKILAGIAIALIASSFITLIFPYQAVTGEMQARLNPSLLDLAVAIISGVAAAYSKSFKEIIQSLAGVAIAVALVPPLTVAGTGIGWGDFHFFSQAFLLFSTNLVGIIIAAALTFRILGFSPAIRSKRSMGIVLCLLALISVPLCISYGRIVEKRLMEQRWQKERFLVNGKYIIVEQADLRGIGGKQVVVMEVVVRDLLNRQDLKEFKKKIKIHFPGKLIVRVKTIYLP